MVFTELASCSTRVAVAADRASGRRRVGLRHVLVSYAALWSLTALAAVAGLLWPALAPAGAPHPALHPTLGAIASILSANIGVLLVPFAVVALRFNASRRSRRCGDALLLIVLGRSATTIGLALGHNGTRLLPYIPQLPLEYAAAAIAASAWLRVHTHPDPAAFGEVARAALLTLALLAAAAVIEVLATPHLP
jgi:hypothetical protein